MDFVWYGVLDFTPFFHQIGNIYISGKVFNKTVTQMIWQNDEFFLDLCFLDYKGKIWYYACVLAIATFLNSLD